MSDIACSASMRNAWLMVSISLASSLPKPSLLATQEFVEGKIYWRDPSKDNENVVEENS